MGNVKKIKSVELSSVVKEKISLNNDNLIEELFKEKLREVYIKEMDKCENTEECNKDYIFENIRVWMQSNKDNLVDEFVLLGREKLIDCIYKILIVTEYEIEETMENTDTGEIVTGVVKKKEADYISPMESKFIDNMNDKELMGAILDEVIDSPFTYLSLYEEVC